MTSTPTAHAPLLSDAATAADFSSPSDKILSTRSESSTTEGIALLLQEELDLRHSVEGILVGLNWPHSAEIDRTLREQLLELSANIAVLNQRYMIPASAESTVENGVTFADEPGRVREMLSLPELIAQYRTILWTIGDLMAKGSDRERGKMILTQVALSHEKMATDLTTFLADTPAFVDSTAVDAPTRGEAISANEGVTSPALAVPASTTLA